jgi:GPH family glycoside/pentoside/hexuronide:cation symporter
MSKEHEPPDDMNREYASEGELSWTTLFSYGAFRFADVLVMQTVASFLNLFYVTTYGVRPMWIALARPVLKGFDVITDPILGQLSDNTKSRMGRRRPWILLGGIALGISYALFFSPKFVLFWIATPAASQIFVWYFICYLLYYASHTVSVVPYYALGAELTDDYNERTRVTAWRHLIALPAVVVAALTYKLATDPRIFPSGEKAGMAVCVSVVGVIVIVLAIVTALGTQEKVELQQQPKMPMKQALRITLSNWPFIVLCGSVLFYQMAYVFVFEFHAYVLIYAVFDGDKGMFGHYFFLATFVMVASAAVANLVARRFARRAGKKLALVVFAGAGLLIPLATTFAFNPAHPQLYFVFAAVLVVGITGMDIVPFSVIADICDLDELESRRRREGAFMGVFNGICKAGVTLSPILTNLSLEVCGFDQSLIELGLPQSDDTLRAMRIALFAIPAALLALSLLCALALPIRRQDVEAAQAELARRREESD